jgi:RNA polymerase sigma-70 factor (ECF subfamily)
MSAEEPFDDVMARLAAGDQDAAARVFRRFAHRLVSLAGARLSARLRGKVDAEDVAQSVFKSFFRRHAEGEFRFTGWDGLWGLLTLMTVRKCQRLFARYRTAKRDVAAELPAGAGGTAAFAALAREPSAAEVLILGELVENLLHGLAERDGAMVSLALQGYDPAEIAAETGASERTVYRVLAVLRGQLRPGDSAGDRPWRRRAAEAC